MNVLGSFSMRSMNSAVSWAVVISAPSATSMTSLKPAFAQAASSCSILPGNCFSAAGAIIATSFSPRFIAASTSTSCERSITAANGQALKHLPQKMHFSKSISATPKEFFLIAPTGHASSHGTVVLTIAL